MMFADQILESTKASEGKQTASGGGDAPLKGSQKLINN